MDDVIQFYVDLRILTKKYGVEFEKKFQNCENPFNMAFNTSTFVLEMLDSYKTKWSSVNTIGRTKEEIKQSKDENASRMALIERMAYIQVMSEIEFCSKLMVNTLQNKSLQSLKNSLAQIAKKKKWIYLRDIMNESQKINLISQDSFDKWRNLIVFRNNCIHNNTVSEKDENVTIEDLVIQYRKGKQVRENLLFIPKLTEKLVNLHKEWVNAL